ncbi:NADP-dependent oxidoreductase [Streptomyces sp. NBC_00306]|uniref:NADP-dependent oxidoreductase n=1 Tax=Streptomyces sp. NBC_00306 TaxID=2975708 RepID=UPI002E282451|nr:NADP-dependent oxidoreductase [Streptomyces sp. NBC_00306]
MEAIVFEEFGGPEVLRLVETAKPQPGPGQVRVRVAAAGVNPLDHKIRNGWMQAVFPTPLPATPGAEFAGTVDAVGEGVTDTAVGDEVLGWTATGAYAQYALSSSYAPKPAGLDWTAAAALPVATETAARVLALLGVRSGETLLVHGAAGVVGATAVQLAVAAGAEVVGTASPANHDYVRSLGATPVAYGEGLVGRVRAVAPRGVDAVFDAAGKGALPDSIELRGGTAERIVTIADPEAGTYGVTFSANTVEAPEPALFEHARLAADGTLRVTIVETFPLAEAAKAQTLSETGHAPGKIVITP